MGKRLRQERHNHPFQKIGKKQKTLTEYLQEIKHKAKVENCHKNTTKCPEDKMQILWINSPIPMMPSIWQDVYSM